MKLARYNPASDNALSPFEGFLRHSFGAFPSFDELFNWSGFPSSAAPASLAADVYEDDGHYYARFEVPGVKKEDAKIELKDRFLTVSVTRNVKTGESESRLTRSVSVPDGIEVDRISAKLEDGLLTVTLPKQEQRKPRLIELS